MTGIPLYNFPAFLEAEADIESKGWQVLSPARFDIERGFNPIENPKAVYTDDMLPGAIRQDVAAIISCQAIAMMDGWEKSNGATAEYHVAIWAKVETYRYFQVRKQLFIIAQP